ncbi:transporter-like protein [Leptomonas pyrrhocoris]|uniref:Transporter-like protein n=1 Tax=Leptomonas pyrrhocoris TaxID=157538 RepID=A0A0N0VHX3_LEPPY|nr:transporter-like protein [Leptomonas pyrrhocoris]KPA86278.1 transporter-like protein [Leptomonas pyrrhocoris]|eukprot:XP_015664717.1 transporter-like protein [Leptomonas pyrrhocoris]
MPPNKDAGLAGETAANPPRVRKAKVTPLPLSQMIPMTFVMVNESICSTMLMPFVGPFVAFLRGVPVNEAGYFSGMIVGMFMLGQVVSAKAWGRISDKYGRRFPIISGLFTSGLMMLGFGLSTNVWLLVVFRFFHGLFNGNVLVAKTMMADITDKTNQAGGFSFMSLCSAFGFLIGPTLGGLLYDPAHSKGLAWAKVDEKGFFGTHPAFLTSLVVFIYTNIGMLVCTFLVKESNQHAQPLPGFIRLVYPCLWYKSEPFVLPPIQYEDESEEEETDERGASASVTTVEPTKKTGTASSYQSDARKHEDLHDSSDSMTISATSSGVVAVPFSPVEKEDDRQWEKEEQETLAVAGADRDEQSTAEVEKLQHTEEHAGEKGGPAGSTVERTDTDRSDDVPVPSLEEPKVTHFGYREAFSSPYTRFMLIQYMMLCATDMAARECFPLWAVATAAAGGLGMTISQVSYILLLNSAPYFVANIFFRIFERKYHNKMGLFRLGMLIAGTAVLLLPFNSYVDSTVLVYVLVFLCTAVRQMFVSWCYSLNTMLTARAAPPGHVGSIMGINQSCNASVRGLTPFIAAPLFAWSISGDHIFPFDHAFIFLLSAAVFYVGWWRSYSIRTDMDGNLQMVQ